MSSFKGPDSSALIARAWKNYRVLSKASKELRPLCSGILSMMGSLQLIEEIAEETQLSSDEESTLGELKGEFSKSLISLESSLMRLRLRRTDVQAVAAISSKIGDINNKLDSFLETLRSHSKDRVRFSLEQLREADEANFEDSIATDWAVLEGELQILGLSKELIVEEFFFIDDWLKGDSTVESQDTEVEHTRNKSDELDESLPGYTPGSQRGTIAEKVQALEQTTRDLTMSVPLELAGSSSKIEPPPYTFEGGDDLLDEDLQVFIRQAIENEASRRFIEREKNPDIEPTPISWLSKPLREQYKDLETVIPMLDMNSFSTMAYETAPACVGEIDRLRQIIQVSYEHKKTDWNSGVIHNASEALKLLSIAISKFVLLQNQHSTSDLFSDLDTLDFEFSTAAPFDDTLQFPSKQFELAQKTYYRLLTYIMGLLAVYSFIFQGRTYLTRSREELGILWKEKKMDARIAWVEKQLAAWDEIERAVQFCRDWHNLRPTLRHQAAMALADWNSAEAILSGAEGQDEMNITIVRASGLPKSSFRSPSTYARLVFYEKTKSGQSMRSSDLKTPICSSTINPVWNNTFLVTLKKGAKMVDIEIIDRLAGMDSELCRARILFSFVPGVEANFADRSLMYGFDEEVELPLKNVQGKGKEKDAPTVRVALKWKGRLARLEEAGLPASPPGKMFKADITGIPFTPEEREVIKAKKAAKVAKRKAELEASSGEGGATSPTASGMSGTERARQANEVANGLLNVASAFANS